MPRIVSRLLAGGVLVAAVGLTTAPANSQLSPSTSSVSEIEEIRGSYKKLFEQESVLRADSRDLVSF